MSDPSQNICTSQTVSMIFIQTSFFSESYFKYAKEKRFFIVHYDECSTFEKQIIRLYYCPGIGAKSFWQIVKYWLAQRHTIIQSADLQQIGFSPQKAEQIHQRWQKMSESTLRQMLGEQQLITFFSPTYPDLLRRIADPPVLLFYQGEISLLQRPSIALVGGREASMYGRKVCERLVPPLIAENYVILSGLAKGVDSFAHESALRNHGKTIAVVGTGVDICYPASSRHVYEEICQAHLVISEYPMGTPPKRFHFPMRNRLIAGIAQGVCVIEAKEKSGSLITAQLALENGREVFAVPGEIISPQSKGCHQLIQDGAKCTIDAVDILQELTYLSCL